MSNMKMDKHPSLPERIYKRILELIKNGQYEIGMKLPGEKEFSKQLDVSRTALREALQRLEMDGYVDRRHGIGTFVLSKGPTFSTGLEQLESITELIRMKGLVPGTTNVTFKEEKLSHTVAEYLQLSKGDVVNRYERVRTADGKPFAFDIAIASSEVLSHDFTNDDHKESIFTFLEDQKSTILTHSYCNIFSENASEELAKKLKISVGESLQVLEQVYYKKGNTPVYYGKSYIRNDVLKFHLIRRR